MISRITKDTKKFKKESRNFGIINFDEDNLYPFHTENLSMNSGILSTCQSIYAKFIYGGGFGDFWNVKINDKDNIDKLFRKMIIDYSKHKSFAVHIRYNGLLDPIELKQIPFQTLRLKYPDDLGNINKVIYSELWHERRITKDELIEYDLYSNDKEIIARQIEAAGGIEKWKGQVYYYGANGSLEYPTNSFHAVIEDVVTNIQIKKGKNANSMTNFLAGYVIEVPFRFEEIASRQNKNRDELKQEFINALQNVQGYDNIGNYILLENDTITTDGKAREVKFHKLDLQDYDKIFEYAETSVEGAIRKNYLIPEIFINPVSTGFSTEIMNDQFHYYNQNTIEDRQIFEEVAMELLAPFVGKQDFSLKPLKYREDIE